MEEFLQRPSRIGQEGLDATVRVQLSKLKEALHDERTNECGLYLFTLYLCLWLL